MLEKTLVGMAKTNLGSVRGNWDPREGQQPFRPRPNGVGDRTTTLRRLLVGADHCCCLVQSSFLMDLTNPGRTFGRFSLLSISPKLLTLSGIPPFSTNLFWLASLLALLVGLNLFLLTGSLVWFIKITCRVRRDVPQGSVLGPVLFSLFINDLPASLPCSVNCSFYGDDLAIWSSSPSVSTAVEATQESLFQLERWSEYWCLPLNPSKCKASFSSVDPHQANLNWRRTVSSIFFDTQVPLISTEELMLPRHARCVLSRLRCNGHSLLLGSYLSRIGRIENPSCSACGHSSQDTFDFILHCPATDSLRRSLFGDSLSLYDLWSRR